MFFERQLSLPSIITYSCTCFQVAFWAYMSHLFFKLYFSKRRPQPCVRTLDSAASWQIWAKIEKNSNNQTPQLGAPQNFGNWREVTKVLHYKSLHFGKVKSVFSFWTSKESKWHPDIWMSSICYWIFLCPLFSADRNMSKTFGVGKGTKNILQALTNTQESNFNFISRYDFRMSQVCRWQDYVTDWQFERVKNIILQALTKTQHANLDFILSLNQKC